MPIMSTHFLPLMGFEHIFVSAVRTKELKFKFKAAQASKIGQ